MVPKHGQPRYRRKPPVLPPAIRKGVEVVHGGRLIERIQVVTNAKYQMRRKVAKVSLHLPAAVQRQRSKVEVDTKSGVAVCGKAA